MQLYKRCARFIWESHLPLLHKLYVLVFFFSVRATSPNLEHPNPGPNPSPDPDPGPDPDPNLSPYSKP